MVEFLVSMHTHSLLAYLLNQTLEVFYSLAGFEIESKLIGVHGLDPESERGFFFVHK